MPRLPRKPLRALVLTVVLGASLAAPAAASACANATRVPAAGNAGKIRAAVLCLVNRERAARGLKRLGDERRLNRAAVRHSRDMVQRNYFNHRSPGGATMIDRAKKARYFARASRWRLAENLAWGVGTFGTPRAIVRGWMRSPAHRANILNGRLREAGVGVARGTLRVPGRGATYTMLFGARR